MSKKKALPVFKYNKSMKRALVVVAHPDDVDFGSAGTIATLTAKGVDVAYCLVTSGDAGGDGSTLTREERSEIRETEQRAGIVERWGFSTLRIEIDGLLEKPLALFRISRRNQARQISE